MPNTVARVKRLKSFHLLRTGNYYKNAHTAIHDPLTNTSNKETFLKDLLVNLEQKLQN